MSRDRNATITKRPDAGMSSPLSPYLAGNAVAEGWLLKRSRKGKWQRRFFQLRGPYLMYWPSQAASHKIKAGSVGMPDAAIDLRHIVEVHPSDENGLVLTSTSGNQLQFKTIGAGAADAESVAQWTSKVAAAIELFRGQAADVDMDAHSDDEDDEDEDEPPAGAAEQGRGLTVERFAGIEVSVNSWLVSNGSDLLVVDCLRNSKEAQDLATAIKLRSDKLFAVFVTHGHPDHYMGLRVLREEFGPDIQFYVAKDEIKQGIEGMAAYMTSLGWMEPAMAPKTPEAPEGFDYGTEINLLPNPGAITLPAGGTIEVKSDYPKTEAAAIATLFLPEENVALMSDLCYNKVHHWCGPDLPEDFDRIDNWIGALKDAIATFESKGNVTICPGHGAMGGVELLHDSIKYLEFFMETVKSAETHEGAMAKIIEAFPDYAETEFLLKMSVGNFLKETEGAAQEPRPSDAARASKRLSALEDIDPSFKGFVSKQGHTTMGISFRKRLFVLEKGGDGHWVVNYYKDSESQANLKGCIRMKGATVSNADGTHFSITTNEKKVFPIRADSPMEALTWVEKMREAVSLENPKMASTISRLAVQEEGAEE